MSYSAISALPSSQIGCMRNDVSTSATPPSDRASCETRALQAPVLGCAVSSVAGAVICWLLSYASYLGDSTASAVACLALLVALLVPGMFLGWVYVSLRRVSKLPGRFNLPAQEIPTGVVTPAPETGASFFSRCLERVRRRVKAAIGVWSLLEYSDGVKSVGGPRPNCHYSRRRRHHCADQHFR